MPLVPHADRSKSVSLLVNFNVLQLNIFDVGILRLFTVFLLSVFSEALCFIIVLLIYEWYFSAIVYVGSRF